MTLQIFQKGPTIEWKLKKRKLFRMLKEVVGFFTIRKSDPFMFLFIYFIYFLFIIVIYYLTDLKLHIISKNAPMWVLNP